MVMRTEGEEVRAAPTTTAPANDAAELEEELLHAPGPTGLPPHAEEGKEPCASSTAGAGPQSHAYHPNDVSCLMCTSLAHCTPHLFGCLL